MRISLSLIFAFLSSIVFPSKIEGKELREMEIVNIDNDSTFFSEADASYTDADKESPFSSPIKNPYKFKGTELIAPGVLLGAGIVGLEWKWWKGINRDIRDDLQKNNHKKIKIDDFTQLLPTVATYGLNLCGVKGKHDMVDLTIIYGTGYLLLAATLYPMKDFIKSERPNQKGFDSFPSGHTAIAFLGAEVLRREYWDVSPWIGIGGYLVAAGTGFMRMYNNAHWLNDVIAGAGLGILCAEAAYWLYPSVTKTFFKKRYNANVFLAPAASVKYVGLSCSIDF